MYLFLVCALCWVKKVPYSQITNKMGYLWLDLSEPLTCIMSFQEEGYSVYNPKLIDPEPRSILPTTNSRIQNKYLREVR